ncbi:MAG: AraC family transcriptional regulator, partial [Chitinophagaceae bacterium]
EYSQKRRLLIAYNFMRSGNSVTDTARVIGYTGINNFTTAFKKEFGMLPSELIEQLKEN